MFIFKGKLSHPIWESLEEKSSKFKEFKVSVDRNNSYSDNLHKKLMEWTKCLLYSSLHSSDDTEPLSVWATRQAMENSSMLILKSKQTFFVSLRIWEIMLNHAAVLTQV